ncbi:uncharacterized protein LOC101858288 isoform X2 [Aplysia californica]|uniref:Uncharacterized protein LOC101858288 isoform X2 n=1 Tax=Aplysia californica TaxID=6500 RepID=A0ABM0JX03_APLCA|nr:uncharacterized protein LOC101858288 isoform X2 [Aplysia californica]
MISSISPRLPRKTCGLFDTGFAGDALDVASLDLCVPADIDQSLFTFGGVGSGDLSHLSEGTSGLSATVVDSDATLKADIPTAPGLMDWSYDDVMDPLGGLGDPLADDSLDAFVNLDSFFMENSFLDNGSLTANEPAEVKPVIAFSVEETAAVSKQATPVKPAQTAGKSPATKTSRKRKAQTSVAAVETTLFKIPGTVGQATMPITAADPQVDHDYIVKSQQMSSSCETVEEKSYSNKRNGTTKRKRISSSASDASEVSTASTVFDDFVDSDTPVDKQAVRRMKNNVASKRSREQRKQKFADMDLEAEQLITENDRLRNKIIELEKLAKEMKAQLVAKMAGTA